MKLTVGVLSLAVTSLFLTQNLGAQQLPNIGFESWKSACGNTNAFGTGAFTSPKAGEDRQRPGKEPTGWNGSSVNQKVMTTVTKELVFQTSGYESDYAAQLKNIFVGVGSLGSAAPGYLTFGTPWVYAESTVANCDGGTYGGTSFTSRPDALSGMFKRVDQNDENSTVLFYSWSGTFKSKVGKKGAPTQSRDNVDRAVMGLITPDQSGTLIGKLEHTFRYTDGEWQQLIMPIEYLNDQTPEMMNVVICGGDYWTRANLKENTELIVDDVKLVYYSRLQSLNVAGFDPDVFDYSVDEYYPENGNPVLNYEVMSTSGSSNAVVNYDPANAKVAITVTNSNTGEGAVDIDGKATHVYTISYKIPVESVTTDGTNATATLDLLTDGTLELKPVILPANASDQSLTWAITGNAATFDEATATLTGVAPGTVTVTATSSNGKSAQWTVNVKPRQVETVTFREGVQSAIFTGASIEYSIDNLVIAPANAYNPAVAWSIEGAAASLATTDGKATVTGLTPGSAKLIATVTSNEATSPVEPAVLTITVSDKPVAVESVTISGTPENNIIVIGQDEVKLTATVLPEDANTITSREWTSSNPDALEVSAEGVLTPKAKAENVEITYAVTYEIDGSSNTISDKVSLNVISPVTEIQGLPSSFEMPLTTHRFELNLLPEDANNLNMTWALSADPDNENEENKALSGASIDDEGNLTTTEYGTFILTATAADGYGAKAECKVTVRPFAESITLSKQTADIYIESTLKIEAEITPENAVETTTLTWTSSDEEVATVTAEGVITGVAEGTAVITASAEGFNGTEIKAEVTVNVKAYPSETTTFPGFLTITTSEGETNTHETEVTIITTSDEHCIVKLPGFKIMGMPVETLTLEKIGYTVDAEGNETTPDSRTYQGSFEDLSVLNGAVTASGTLTGSNVGTELTLNATVNVESWGETVEVIFAPSYQAPFTGAVNNTYLPGTLNVTLTDADHGNETVTAEIPLTVNIATSVNSEGEILPTCSIEIPAYTIGRFDFPEMKFDNVSVTGASTLLQFYSQFESFEVNDEIGSITGTLEGSMKGHEMAQISINFNFDYSHVSVQSTFSYGQISDNIYQGTLTIDMGGSDITGGGQEAVVIITPSADGMNCTLTLPDFELTGIGKLGDIVVTDVEMVDDGIDRIVYKGQTMGMQLMDGAIEADVYLNGYSTYEGFATFDIIVVWNGINIRVRFNGELSTGNLPSSVEVTTTDNEVPMFYNLNGIRLNVENVSSLPAGLYIERCGNKTRKILVK